MSCATETTREPTKEPTQTTQAPTKAPTTELTYIEPENADGALCAKSCCAPYDPFASPSGHMVSVCERSNCQYLKQSSGSCEGNGNYRRCMVNMCDKIPFSSGSSGSFPGSDPVPTKRARIGCACNDGWGEDGASCKEKGSGVTHSRRE